MEPEDNTPGSFKRIAIPLVRRIYPQLIADKIVSVQPLSGPTGLVYHLRHRYSEHKNGFDDTRTKKIKPKKYRSIDDPWES